MLFIGSEQEKTYAKEEKETSSIQTTINTVVFVSIQC